VKPAGKGARRRARFWMALRLLVLAVLSVGAAWWGTSKAWTAPTLQVAHIVVRGEQRLGAGEVAALIDGLRGQNIFGVRLDEWRARVLSSPWVEDAVLRRVLPSTIEVTIHERTPMGIARVGNALYLIDGHGVIVDEYGPTYADINLPVVDGLATAAKGGEVVVNDARAALAAKVMAALQTRPALMKRVALIDVKDPHDAVVMLEGDTTQLRVGEDEFVDRLQQYLDLGEALKQRVAEIDYVDLRFSDRLYVRPATGTRARGAQARP
jgi:cell division protein FtsQ